MSLKKIQYGYVFASTMNQMVNYIPLVFDFRHIEIDKNALYNFTLFTDEKLNRKTEENHNWDEKLYGALGLPNPVIEIKLNQESAESKRDIATALEVINSQELPILWNITGGQRYYIIALLEFIKDRKDDLVVYLDGNKGRFKWMKGQLSDNEYSIEGLTIPKALNLMGFDMKDLGKYEYYPNNIPDMAELVREYKNNESLRKACIQSNRAGDKEKSADQLKALGISAIDALLEKYPTTYPFGYILEEMVIFEVYTALKDQIANISHSVKITSDGIGTILDEFDILILTKTGQMINIECKSGFMDGNVAKSTKYSTYAVSGAYGFPILVTPVLSNEIGTAKLDQDSYNAINRSIGAAKRAKLLVCGLDNIIQKIKTRFNLS